MSNLETLATNFNKMYDTMLSMVISRLDNGESYETIIEELERTDLKQALLASIHIKAAEYYHNKQQSKETQIDETPIEPVMTRVVHMSPFYGGETLSQTGLLFYIPYLWLHLNNDGKETAITKMVKEYRLDHVYDYSGIEQPTTDTQNMIDKMRMIIGISPVTLSRIYRVVKNHLNSKGVNFIRPLTNSERNQINRAIIESLQFMGYRD